MSERIVDVRGETCPGPALRVERLLSAMKDRQPFTVKGDHRPTLESLPFLAERYGWIARLEPAPDGGWHVLFRPPPPAPG